ncbi:CHC2 zinc finger domain-containing protein [Chloroflexota bacterium]
MLQAQMRKEHEPEQPTNREVDPNLATAYAATFISRYDMYPAQRPDGSYITLKKKLSQNLIVSHLQGYITLGAYALDTNSQSRWLCLDADNDEQWAGVYRLAKDLNQRCIPSYLETSRRGGHLWLFTNSMPGADVRRFGKQLLHEYDLEDVELYPKQDKLKTGPGSLVRMPLGVHQKTGKRYSFVTLNGQPLAPTIREQIGLLVHPGQVPEVFISDVLSRVSTVEEETPPPVVSIPDQLDSDEPLSTRLKQAISVPDYVSQYVELDKQGRGHCPFHDDARKSFSVNQDKNFWYCFAGCGGGSIIDFKMRQLGKTQSEADFTAAIKALANEILP